jgi:hypothetical protein
MRWISSNSFNPSPTTDTPLSEEWLGEEWGRERESVE